MNLGKSKPTSGNMMESEAQSTTPQCTVLEKVFMETVMLLFLIYSLRCVIK